MNPMIPNLHGSKMSSSHPPDSKIMFLDDAETVERKILEAPWRGLDPAENGVLSIIKFVLLPVAELQCKRQRADESSNDKEHVYINGDSHLSNSVSKGANFKIETDGKCHIFESYDDFAQSLTSGIIQPGDAKAAAIKGINSLLRHVRKIYENDSEWQAVDALAYPETV